MPTGFWVKGYWGGGSAEPINTIQIKLSAEPIKNIQIEGSAEPIKIIQYHETTDASTQAPPLALVPVTCPHRASCNLYIVNVGLHSVYTCPSAPPFSQVQSSAAGIDHTIKKEAAAVVTQTNKVCIFAAPLCVAWSLTMCLVLALSHIKSPQPEVSEYAWALCYPPSP